MNASGYSRSIGKMLGFFLGPAVFFLLLLSPLPGGMSIEALRVAACALWIAIWWITEPVPIPVTSLLPLILFPLTQVSSIAVAARGYSNHLIFLFLGGFFIALCLEKWHLHRRIALSVVFAFRRSLRTVLFAFILVTGIMSMWISNTATTMLMFTIGIALLAELPSILKESMEGEELQQQLKWIKPALLISIAYAASLGGMGTIIGTPPNAILVGSIKELFSIEIGFAQWMIVGVPLSLGALFFLWVYMTFVAYRISNKPLAQVDFIRAELKKMGPMSKEERRILIVFIATALAWLTRSWLLTPIFPQITDSVIAILGSLALFIIPSSSREKGNLLDWKTALRAPWGLILLFGAGFSLAGAIQSSGLSAWIGTQMEGLQEVSPLLILFLVVTVVAFLTEITSNTATATVMMPIMGGLAVALGASPSQFMVGAALAASCAFMLPVATPPNAIVFSGGHFSVSEMARKGLSLNIVMIVVITMTVYWILPYIIQ